MLTLHDTLTYNPSELSFGTSGLRGLVSDMTDLENYINTRGFIRFMQETQDLKPNSVIYLAGDLRESTPRIIASVYQAISDSGLNTEFGGFIPTPAVALYGLLHGGAAIMVTGSHIPADRNGIKFNKIGGEVLKDDETAIKEAVALVRQEIYSEDADLSAFTPSGSLKNPPAIPEINSEMDLVYKRRYTDAFPPDILAGKKIIFYQHSCVGRDSIPTILEALGAEVVRVNRTDYFVPIDTENVTVEDQAFFKQLARENSGLFAIVSTDGDSDRPFVIDEFGIFHRGDELGAVVASWLHADFAALPISASDGVTDFLTENNITWKSTRIGSPYVIAAMAASSGTIPVGWEVNGGFLIGSDMETKYGKLAALPTRDAFLPILVALIAAIEKNQSVSALFSMLPKRYTQAGMINDFPTEVSRSILNRFSDDTPETRAKINTFFSSDDGFGTITATNNLDGLRITFDNGDIAHLRPSGNAPQLRIYSVAGSQERADEIVRLAIAEPDGILRTIEHFDAN